MPLYEFLLEFPERREVRIGDRAPRVGDIMTVGGRTWLVDERLPGADAANARFRLLPTNAATGREEATNREQRPSRASTRRLPKRPHSTPPSTGSLRR